MGQAVNARDIGGSGLVAAGTHRVAAWHPAEEAQGKPTQVHLILALTPESFVALRMNSRAAVLALIEELQEHADLVWPPE